MITLYKHRMIRDLTYEIVASRDNQVKVRESHSGRTFWIDLQEFKNNYEKK